MRDLGFVVAFGGAVLGSMVIYVYPTRIMLAAAKKGKVSLDAKETLACRAINAGGFLLAAVGGSVAVLKQLAK